MQDDESTTVPELTGLTVRGGSLLRSVTMRNLPAVDASIVDDRSFSGSLSFDGGSVHWPSIFGIERIA